MSKVDPPSYGLKFLGTVSLQKVILHNRDLQKITKNRKVVFYVISTKDFYLVIQISQNLNQIFGILSKIFKLWVKRSLKRAELSYQYFRKLIGIIYLKSTSLKNILLMFKSVSNSRKPYLTLWLWKIEKQRYINWLE